MNKDEIMKILKDTADKEKPGRGQELVSLCNEMMGQAILGEPTEEELREASNLVTAFGVTMAFAEFPSKVQELESRMLYIVWQAQMEPITSILKVMAVNFLRLMKARLSIPSDFSDLTISDIESANKPDA